MKVVTHNPAPAPVPPVTYDLVGITEEQMRALVMVVSRCDSGSYPEAAKVFQGLYKSGFYRVLQDDGVYTKYRWS